MAAVASVFRVICRSTGSGGTGFVHKSGKVLTAAHVVQGCPITDLVLVGASDTPIAVTEALVDPRLDVALLAPATALPGALPIRGSSELAVGALVATWGYPEGYFGRAPLLSVGYLAGIGPDAPRPDAPGRIFVNAAFNSGNSGGPLILVEDGTVIGVVVSKLAPIPPSAESALAVLTKQGSGWQFTVRLPDGKMVNRSEGQVVAEVLTHLRRQTQLVVGMAVLPDDLRAFLVSNKVEP